MILKSIIGTLRLPTGRRCRRTSFECAELLERERRSRRHRADGFEAGRRKLLLLPGIHRDR
jgi:hypothetical protein